MVERLLKRNSLGVDQLLTGGAEGQNIAIQMPGDRGIGVITQPLDVGDGDQEQVQGPSPGLAAAEHALADESVIDPTEGGGDLAQSIRPQRMFMNHKQELRERPVG